MKLLIIFKGKKHVSHHIPIEVTALGIRQIAETRLINR